MPLETVVKRPSLHALQRKMRREKKSRNVACLGRRTGKTFFCIDEGLEALFDGYPVAWFAPTNQMHRNIWREFVRILAPLIRSKNKTEKRIELWNGAFIDFYSFEAFNGVRGSRYKVIVLDEAAMVKNLLFIWETAIEPTLLDYQELGTTVWFASTPNGLGDFYTLYERASQPQYADEWASFHGTSYDNTKLTKTEAGRKKLIAYLDYKRRTLPAAIFEQEYLARFRVLNGGVFRNVNGCLTSVEKRKPERGHQYVFGVDTAKTTDWTVIVVLDITTRQVVYIDRFQGVSYLLQVERIKRLADTYRPVRVIVEQNNASMLIDVLERRGVPVEPFLTTNATKKGMIETLALAFEQGAIGLYAEGENADILLNELNAFQVVRDTPTTYGAPAGQHDDCVMALALAFTALENPLSVRYALEDDGDIFNPETLVRPVPVADEPDDSRRTDAEIEQLLAGYYGQMGNEVAND